MGLNLFSLNGLEGISRARLAPEIAYENPPISGEIRVNFR
jgi:hypothetical protein